MSLVSCLPDSSTRTDEVFVHDGFHKAQAQTTDMILSAVKRPSPSTGYKNVLITGCSLVTAIASFDAAMMKMALPFDIAVFCQLITMM